MGSKFNKKSVLRSFLAQNLIALLALALSAVAIIVSINSNTISNKQNELAEVSLQPSFKITRSLSDWDTIMLVRRSSYITVFLNDGHCDNFSSETILRFRVNYGENKKGWDKFYIYANGPYMITQPGGREKGMLQIIGSKNNNIESDEFERLITSIVNNEGYDCFLNPELFIKINYTDKNSTPHSKYYNVHYEESETISATEGDQIFNEGKHKLLKGQLFKTYDLKEETPKIKGYLKTAMQNFQKE